MKKKLTFFVYLIALTTSYSQTIFSADFEDGTLGGMTIVDNDGLNTHSSVSPFDQAWTIPEQVFNDAFGITSEVAISNSRYDPAGTADDWLITPQLMIVDEGTAVTWIARALSNNSSDGMEVRVSTTNANLDSFTDVIYSSAAEATEFTERAASLNAYIDQQIYVAFVNNSTDKYLLAIDDIAIKVLSTRDVELTSLSTEQYQLINQDAFLAVNILNVGGDEITSLDLKWSIGANEYTETITGLNLLTGETTIVSSSTPFIPTEAIVYPINIEITNPNGAADSDDSNNTIDVEISGITYVPSRRVIGEEGTGTWCGWCPRGTVALEYMDANYSESFISIAVHNSDPMTVSEYDQALGFASFPDGKINRKLNMGPSLFESGFNEVKDNITPIAIEVTAFGNESDRILNVVATAETVTQLINKDYRLSVIVTEDGVTGTDASYNQVNNFSGGAAGDLISVSGVNWADLPDPVLAIDMVYDHVARAVLGGFNGLQGSIDSDLNAGDLSTQEFSWTVPESMDMNELHAIVLVLDNATGEILNGAKTDLTLTTSTNEVNDSFISNVYPNPAVDIININSVELIDRVDVLTPNGQVIRSMDYEVENLDIRNLPRGIYFIRVVSSNRTELHKITKM